MRQTLTLCLRKTAFLLLLSLSTLEMADSESNYIDEHSAASTTITFDRPVPLLRGPVRAGPHDDPSAGPYVLAFRDPRTWANAYRACESKIIEQCEAGARIGCAISASDKCKPPWWRALIGPKAPDLKQREQCEEREMEGCFAAAKDKCVGFAKEKCLKPFRDARIAGLHVKQAERLVCWATVMDRSTWLSLIGLDKLGYLGSGNYGFGATNYRASELFGSDCDFDLVLGSSNGILKV